MKSIARAFLSAAAVTAGLAACSGASPGTGTTTGNDTSSSSSADASADGAGSCQSPSDCTGFLPENAEVCADGTSQPAQWDCNAGTCAVSYCDNNGGVGTPGSAGVDAGSAPSASGTCQSPSDCTGFLPASAEVCADGTSQPAQWDCDTGTCTVSYCDNTGRVQDGTTATKGDGCLLVLDPNGQVVSVWSGPTINDPWGDMNACNARRGTIIYASCSGSSTHKKLCCGANAED